jgi:Protein of unknown function (DUF1449)
MAELLSLALGFPSVVFTVLLGVVLVYWSFVIVGVIHIGEGSEGALDGLGEGSVDGAAKGLLESHALGAEGHDGVDFDGDGPDLGDAGQASALAAILGALRLRSAPATVVLSLLITFSWLVCVVSMQAATRLLTEPGALLSWLALLGAPLFALPLTSLAVRPLARFFALKRAPAKMDFIGHTCVVRTGTVTTKFGEATLEDGGAGLVLRVRVDGDARLGRGEHALIVDYDAERETYLVEPISDVLPAPRRR